MASIAVRLTADVAGLTQGFGQAEKMAEGFRNRLTQIGKATAKAFIPTGVSVSAVATDLGNLASVASSSAAILSKFTQGNKEMQERLEQVTVTLAIAAPAIRGFGSALRLATGPIGLVVTALVGAILVLRNWETVTRAVTDTAARVWAKLAEFFISLWGGLGQAAQGLGQILLGALTLDVARIQDGYQQMIAGFTAVKDTMVTAAVGIASGIGTVITKLENMASALTNVEDKAAKSVAALNPLVTELAKIESGILQDLEVGAKAFEEQQQRIAEAQANAAAAALQMDADFQAQLAAIHSALLQELDTATATFNERQTALAAAEEERRNVALAQAQQDAIAGLAILAAFFGQNKAFAIAMTIINTAAGIARALRDYPWPFSIIVGGIVAAAGAAQLATIASIKLAHGGIVTRPITPLIGEAGPEAVIPLTGSRGRAALASLGGGGDLVAHFHFNGHELAKIVIPLIPGFVRVHAGIRTA